MYVDIHPSTFDIAKTITSAKSPPIVRSPAIFAFDGKDSYIFYYGALCSSVYVDMAIPSPLSVPE